MICKGVVLPLVDKLMINMMSTEQCDLLQLWHIKEALCSTIIIYQFFIMLTCTFWKAASMWLPANLLILCLGVPQFLCSASYSSYVLLSECLAASVIVALQNKGTMWTSVLLKI